MAISLLAGAYLFFGGAGAGTFFWSALEALALLAGRGCANIGAARIGGRLVARGFIAALVLLEAGMLCLIFDLGRPSQALLVFTSPTLSYLTVGAYLLATLAVLAAALILIRAKAPAKPQVKAVSRVLASAGAAVALGVAAYTGLLLRDLAPIHLWTSWWLPALFVASSLAAGLAVCALVANLGDEPLHVRRPAERRLAKADLTLLAAELIFAACYLADVSQDPLGTAGVEALLTGTQAIVFTGGFAICGILVPAICDIVLVRGGAGQNLAAFAALCSIVGCFCLRLALVAAGVHIVF